MSDSRIGCLIQIVPRFVRLNDALNLCEKYALIGKQRMFYFYVFMILEIVGNVSFSHIGVRDVLVRCMLVLCCLWSQGSCFLVFVMLLMEC